jgi:uncharacterized damage-inducible protein DinB
VILRAGLRLWSVAAVLAAVPGGIAGQGAPGNFIEEFEGQFGSSGSKIVALAEAMPAEVYGWSPGEGVATVATVFMHIARYNYMYPHENMGRPSPFTPEEYGRWEDEVTDKAEVVRLLNASVEYVYGIARGTKPSDLDVERTLYGRQVGEWAVLLQLVTHMNEHLGQSIAYARMNGVVPPWSR